MANPRHVLDPNRKKLALGTLTADDRAFYNAHGCSVQAAGGCLQSPAAGGGRAGVSWATAVALRALLRDVRLDEKGLSNVIRLLLAGHASGVQDFLVEGRSVCKTALLWCLSISEYKYTSILATVAGGAGSATLRESINASRKKNLGGNY